MSGRDFINSGLPVVDMGRKTRKKDVDDRPMFVKCGICSDRVHWNAPMDGIIYQIQDEFKSICQDCGEMLLQVLDIARNRWG